MTWGTLMATALGGIIGIGSTVFIDISRARRDRDSRSFEYKRSTYVRFVGSLMNTYTRMVQTAYSGVTQPERRAAVHEAFHGGIDDVNAGTAFRELAVSAPEPVLHYARECFEELRRLRNQLADSEALYQGEGYVNFSGAFFERVEELQTALRADLRANAAVEPGPEPLSIEP